MIGNKEIPISAAGKSDVGRVREENEDGFFIQVIKPKYRDIFGIRAVVAVADGMGGHVGGRAASSTAVAFLADLFLSRNRGSHPHFGNDIDSFIIGLINEINTRVHDIGRGESKAPGTTFTGAFIVDNQAFIGHIGDSRAYHIRNDEIVPITEDHSYAAHLVKMGKLSIEEAAHFPQKNVLMRSLGTEGGILVDEPRQAHLLDGDVLFLCTDGLWDLVSEKEITAVIQKYRDLEKACTRLISIANARGGHDNITVVAARIGAFRKGAAARLSDLVPVYPSRRRIGRLILRFFLFSGLIILSTLMIAIVLFILAQSGIIAMPSFMDSLMKTIAP